MQATTLSGTTGAGLAGAWKQFISTAVFEKPGNFHLSAWTEHIPFAFWLVQALQPARFAELGTHYGLSYFSFCQAIKSAGLPTRCYAIDNWTGDEHAGFYNDDVYESVAKNNAAYAGFSTLYRRSFDEAVELFEDGSIDLLHIDGLHTYEAVKHDFDNWLPKMSDSGIVLFHDTSVKDRDFGVHQLWAELEKQYPSFNFTHGFGLGILGIGKNLPAVLDSFFETMLLPEAAGNLRKIYERLGLLCKIEMDAERLTTAAGAGAVIDQSDGEAKQPGNIVSLPDSSPAEETAGTTLAILESLQLQVYWRTEADPFNEPNSVVRAVPLTIDDTACTLPVTECNGTIHSLRIDPGNGPGLFYLHDIIVSDANNHLMIDWEAIRITGKFNNLIIVNSAVKDNGCLVICLNGDPRIEIEMPAAYKTVFPSGICVTMRVARCNEAWLQQEFAGISLNAFRV